MKYFADAYRALAKEIITAVKDAKKQYGFPVFATGHSLGGALATLLSFELAHEHGITPIVYTYGQPRVGNYEFAKKFDQLVPQMYRVVRNRDVVAHIPFCKAIYLPELANPNPERLSMVNKSATETFEEIDEIMRNHYELVAKSGHLRGSEDLDEFELRMKSCYEGKDGEFAPYHPTTEIWYRDTSGPMTDFVECKGYPIGEDNGCSNGQLNTSVGDHVTYFGIRVGSWCIDQLSTDIKMA